jgi:hypothetical protein
LIDWLSSSNPSEHFEVHTILALGDDTVGPQENGVYALFSKDTKTMFARSDRGHFGFELTFMMVEDSVLDRLDRLKAKGLLPKSWS